MARGVAAAADGSPWRPGRGPARRLDPRGDHAGPPTERTFPSQVSGFASRAHGRDLRHEPRDAVSG